MSRLIRVCVVLLSVGLAAQAQTSKPAAPVSAQTAKPKAKSEEQLLLEQLNEKFGKLEDLTEKVVQLQRQVDELKKQLATRDAQVQQGQPAAIQAQAVAPSAEPQPAVSSSTVTALQEKVDALTTANTELTKAVEANRLETKTLENPTTIHFKGIDLTPGGFLAGETVNRQRGTGGDVNTQFNGIPFSGQTAGVLSEFNASGRQSRISLLAEGKLSNATMRGYYEADFLSAGTTSNDNQSNSYTLRQRQLWAQAAFNNGLAITAGQMWSLATEYKTGLANNSEAIPLTIDAQYNVGFTWERQYGFRVVKNIGSHLWLGGSLEEAQTLNIGGHNLPTIAYQQAGNAGGLYNPSANYSYNYAPDLIAKIAYERGFGHFELFGIGRFFRDRVYPNGQAVAPSALGAYTAKTEGGGIGANATVSLFAKKLDIGAHGLFGSGIGRYSTSTLPDATAHPDGSLELLTGGSALGKVEWHATPRMDVYGYYGGEYAKRAFYNTGVPDANNQYIVAGYGAPTNNVSGCYTEVLPTTLPNGGGSVPGSTSNCNADTRNIQEGTFGYWYRFYQGPKGTFQQGFQYSYAVRHSWVGFDPTTGFGFSPKAIDNMWFTSIRYYLPR